MGAEHIRLNGLGGALHHQLDTDCDCQMDDGVGFAGQAVRDNSLSMLAMANRIEGMQVRKKGRMFSKRGRY